MRRSSSSVACALLPLLACCGPCAPKPAPQPVAVAPPPAARSAPDPVVVEMSAVRGDVQFRRGAEGTFSPANPPLALHLDDTLRTSARASATLTVGKDGTIEVRERTEVSVRQLLFDRARFRLVRGRVAATPGKGRIALAVEASGSSAVAEATEGSFAVFSDGEGLVAVVAEAGEVKLSSGGGDAVLAAGEGARVVGSAAPQREAVPRSVLLKVAWPSDKVTRRETMTVRGEADPGAAVSVNGRAAQISPDGRFEAEVPLTPGPNRISVNSTDRFGRSADDSALLEVDRERPPVKVDSEGWK